MTEFKFSDAILSQHTACLGKTGSGKTSTAKLLVEQLVAEGKRVCVLDPIKSDWWGITAGADGNKGGLPFYILGGPRGHVPLHETAGKAIGEVVATGALPLSIVDMANFKVGGLHKFFTDFAESLLKKMRGNVWLVIEEAHEFAPKERSGIGDENLGIYWAKKLATAGRSKGLRLVVLTQRTQALHNAMLGSCETVIAHRMTAPADQLPIVNWLKANTPKDVAKTVAESLSSLKTGEGWLCSGEAEAFERIKFPRIATYDNTSGKGSGKAVKTATVDADALKSIVGEAIAEAKANDPVALKAEIKRLNAELSKQRGAVDPVAIQRAVDAALDGERARKAKLIRKIDSYAGILNALESGVADAKHQLDRLRQTAGDPIGVSPEAPRREYSTGPAPSLPHVTRVTVNRSTTPPVNGRVTVEANGDLPPGARKILAAIAQHPEGCSLAQIQILTGYKASSRKLYLGQLRSAGYAQGSSTVTATPAGIAALGSDYEPLPTGSALRAYWQERLHGGEFTLFEVICSHYPETVDRETLEAESDYKASSRKLYMQKLRSRKLIVDVPGGVQASPLLFD